jgi:fructose-1,6-bisphosphatase
MNRSESIQMAERLRELGGTDARVHHHGHFDELTPKVENDGKWWVELWTVNVSTGNRELTTLERYTLDEKELKAVVRMHKGKARKADAAVLARILAEQEE